MQPDYLETDFFNYLEDIHLQRRIEMWFQLDEWSSSLWQI